MRKIATYAIKYAIWVVLAHILIAGILVVVFAPSYLSKSIGAVAAVVSWLTAGALWAKRQRPRKSGS